MKKHVNCKQVEIKTQDGFFVFLQQEIMDGPVLLVLAVILKSWYQKAPKVLATPKIRPTPAGNRRIFEGIICLKLAIVKAKDRLSSSKNRRFHPTLGLGICLTLFGKRE